jgi:hypothetical protein
MSNLNLQTLQLEKISARKALENLPDNFSAADLLEQVLLQEDIKQGLLDIRNGNTYSHNEMLKMIESWSV